jgi:AcrR family transcriptional regulator
MPKIKAASVAEHVAEQEQAVFATAIRLFLERGYENVTLGDIAASIGLARNSLYRYFPDKAHILLRWFENELPRQASRSAELLGGPGSPVRRIEAWALDQLDYAATPEHALIAAIGTIVPDLDPATRAELAASHDAMLRPLLAALHEAGIQTADEQRIVADMIQQLVLTTARADSSPAAPGRRYLLRAIRGLLGLPRSP